MNALMGVAQARRHGRRRHAVQPAQDVLDAARRRRARAPVRSRCARCSRDYLPVPRLVRRGERLAWDDDAPEERRSRALVLRQLRHPGARARLHRAARRPGARGGDAAGDPERQLPARAPRRPSTTCRYDTPSMHECVFSRPHLQAARRAHARRREAAARLRLLCADDLLPAGREGRAHDRADRDRDARRRSTSSSTRCCAIAEEARTDPARGARARRTDTRLARLDETRAARRPVLRWRPARKPAEQASKIDIGRDRRVPSARRPACRS